jgi:hypothetical protein
MANLPWLEEVRKRLVRHSLPPSYVQRFVAELADHFYDLKEETMSAEADVCSRLGEPEQVADAAVVAYRRRSFLGRHSTAAFLFFAVSPVVSLFVLLFGLVKLFEILPDDDSVLDFLRHLGPTGRMAVPYVLSVLFPVVPCVVVSILHCKLARRLGLGRKWMLISCSVLAVVAATFIWSATFSETPGQSALRIGIGIPRNIVDLPKMVACIFSNPLRVAQFLVPLAIGWCFIRHKSDPSPLQLAS